MKKTVLVFLGIHLVFFSYSKEQNLIEAVNCSKNSIQITLSEDLKKKNYVLEDFFVEYNDDEIDCTQLDYSIVTMPAVMNLITLIWATGNTYYIDAMDAQLFYSLQTVKEVFKRLYPNTSWQGELKPRSLVNNTAGFLIPPKNEEYIAVLFSHGLDSIYTSLKHSDKKQLLLTAWGHSDCPLGYDKVWQHLSDLVISFAKKFKQKFLFFSSNYHSFLNFKYIDSTMSSEISSWRMQAIEGLGFIGLVAPVLLSKGYVKLYIASSLTWDNPFPGAPLPVIDENIAFAGIQVIHDAFDVLREEKGRYIAQQCKSLEIPYMYLRVCSMIRRNGGMNCSNCEKCFRTITNFLLLGEDLKRFGFDISNAEAIAKIKEYLPSSKIDVKKSQFWRTLQKFGKKNLKLLDPLHESFAKWFIQLDIDLITIFYPTQEINWNHFLDLYDKIPEYVLKN